MTVPVIYLGAERAFGLSDVVTDRDDVSGSIPTGPWLTDRHGTPMAGALGLLVDDVLGYSIVRARAEGRWPVSSEISLDILRPLDIGTPGGSLQATTVGPVRADDLGGHVTGTVADVDGEVVAVCTQRGRWIPFDGTFAAVDAGPVDLGAACLEDLLGGRPVPVEGGAVLRLVVRPLLANPLGNLHGGLALCASDLVASAAVTTWETPWVTESLRIEYLRPIPGGSEIEFTATVRHAGRTRAVVGVTGSVGGRPCVLAHITGRPMAS